MIGRRHWTKPQCCLSTNFTKYFCLRYTTKSAATQKQRSEKELRRLFKQTKVSKNVELAAVRNSKYFVTVQMLLKHMRPPLFKQSFKLTFCFFFFSSRVDLKYDVLECVFTAVIKRFLKSCHYLLPIFSL